MPQEMCNTIYATSGYEQSAQNIQQTSLDTDMVFSDGYATQLAKASGGPGPGVTLKLNVGV